MKTERTVFFSVSSVVPLQVELKEQWNRVDRWLTNVLKSLSGGTKEIQFRLKTLLVVPITLQIWSVLHVVFALSVIFTALSAFGATVVFFRWHAQSVDIHPKVIRKITCWHFVLPLLTGGIIGQTIHINQNSLGLVRLSEPILDVRTVAWSFSQAWVCFSEETVLAT